MADLTQAYDALRKADAAGNTADAKRLADYIRTSAPPQEKTANAALPQSMGQPVGDEKLPGFSEAADMVKAIPAGAGQALERIGTAAQHPIDAVGALLSKIPGGARTVLNALSDPAAATKQVGQYLKNLKPESVGNMIGSMAVGGAAGKAAGVLGDVVGPSIKALQKPASQTVKDLAAKGVVTTPGMRGGKIPSAIEQRLTSVPIVGDVIKGARAKTSQQWNRAELNDAIKDAGGKPLPKDRTGRDAIFHAETEMGHAYSRVLSKMHGDLNSADSSGVTFRQFMDQTKQMATQGLEPSAAKIVHDVIDSKVIGKFTAAGRGSGETIKEVQESLRTEINDLKGGNYQERKVAQALQQVSADMKAMLKRENPTLAPQLDKVDRGYAKFKASSQASLYSTKNAGGYTPAQKLRAIRARDKSKDKQRFASGTAPGQKSAEEVESVIGNTEPDSGTAGRLATMGEMLQAAIASPAAVAYSQPVLKMLQNRALKRGGAYTPVGAAAPVTGAALAGSTDENGIGR